MSIITNPKVSAIITTKNEEKNIEACLESIRQQTYKNIQILVIDNSSDDRTKDIARSFTKYVFDKGPERSSQRNFGAEKALGEYVLFLDADMILSKEVVKECVDIVKSKDRVGGVIIPEESFGEGFWSQCKKLERSFYIGNDAIEAARFYPKLVFEKVGGFDVSLTGPEDWDLSQRVRSQYRIVRIKSLIFHNEGNLSLLRTVKKKYYYSKKFAPYMRKTENTSYMKNQFGILQRYTIFLSHPKRLFKNPIIGLGMIFMKTSEFVAGGIGYLSNKRI